MPLHGDALLPAYGRVAACQPCAKLSVVPHAQARRAREPGSGRATGLGSTHVLQGRVSGMMSACVLTCSMNHIGRITLRRRQPRSLGHGSWHRTSDVRAPMITATIRRQALQHCANRWHTDCRRSRDGLVIASNGVRPGARMEI